MPEKINVVLIIEMLGKPADYVKQVLSELIDKLGKEKDVKLISKNIAEPKKVEEDVFSTFAEVEIETDLDILMMVLFAYMPSHIDIINPEDLRIKNSDLNLFFNELTRKLHQYDEVAKTLMLERGILLQRLQQAGAEAIEEKEALSEKKKIKKNKKKKRLNSG